MSAYGDAILASFEDPNAFAVLQPFHEESITDIEPTEQILLRVMRSHLEQAEDAAEKEGMQITKIKTRSFEDGELDGSWTIVARRRPCRVHQFPEEETQTPMTSEVSSSKETDDSLTKAPKGRWRKWMTVMTSVAAVGVVSFLLVGKRNKKNE